MIESTFTPLRPFAAAALLGLLALPLAAQAKAAPPAKASPAAPPAAAASMTEDDKAFYAVGLSIWKSLAVFDASPAEIALIQRGLSEAAAGKAAADVSVEASMPKVQALIQARQQQRVAKEKARGAEFAAQAARQPGAVKTDSGLVYVELAAGSGEAPKETDKVKVHYRGTLVDGSEFDSSYKRNQPAEFPLKGVVKCWTEGVQKMKVGGKARLVCPPEIAYGDNGRPSIPGGATLDFEIELLEILPQAPAPTPAPPAPSAPKQ